MTALLATACGHPRTVHSPMVDHAAMGGPRMAGACEASAIENTGKQGCYFDRSVPLGIVHGPVWYYVDEFPDVAAAQAAAVAGSAVVQAYGRTFLQTVDTRRDWRPSAGRRLATVGPMTAPGGEPVIARFMQAMTAAGATTRPHRHDGPEAFYVLSGAICMETPDGARTTAAGGTYWVAGDVPMQLTSTGDGLRRSLFVVLHAASKPWMTMAPDWTPRGTCRP